jgi:hypothetical protein
MDNHVVELGIACEACHGPGGAHVRANRSPLRRYALRAAGKGDDTIVHPGKLPPRKASEACGQCHSVYLLSPEQQERWLVNGLEYVPGGDLAPTRTVVVPGSRDELALSLTPDFLDQRFWRDGMVRVSGREYNGLLASPCYQHDDESRVMTCMSCHQMHVGGEDDRTVEEWRDDQLAPGMRGDLACTQCHESFADEATLVAHSRHPATSEGSRCQNCHSPYTTYGLLKAIRSHQVSSPSVQESVEAGRPNACNLCHLDRTLEWTAKQLRERHGVAEADLPLTEDQRTVAASILWALQGDAGQRALVAWAFGWPPAREASGTDWMVPPLAQLMLDPYPAVRFMAHRSFVAGGEDDLGYDPAVPGNVPNDLLFAWVARAPTREVRSERLLIAPNGMPLGATFERLLDGRDDRLVRLVE